VSEREQERARASQSLAIKRFLKMPPKKKSSSNKKGKQKTEAEVLDLDSWARNPEKIEGKLFAKKLPETAEQLRTGQVDHV
jgi:hypothetical protein